MSEINVGAISEALNEKTDRDMRNVDTVAGGDAVIEYQAPTAENNYTWYRKYKSGWVEMGGAATIPGRSDGGGSEVVVNLPVTMKYVSYQASISIHDGSTYWASWGVETSTRTTTTLRLYAYLNTTGDAAALPVFWEVKGMAA